MYSKQKLICKVTLICIIYRNILARKIGREFRERVHHFKRSSYLLQQIQLPRNAKLIFDESKFLTESVVV